MARPRSDDKRNAIFAAAIRVIAAEGPGVATATIANEAGVSNGSLFTYFKTKADLFNQLYLELKAEMAAVALDAIPLDGDARAKMRHVWVRWVHWATATPEKRRTIKQLDVSDNITPATHQAARQSLTALTDVLDMCRKAGPLRDAPLPFIVSLANALAEATIDDMIGDPLNAKKHEAIAFDAFWRMISE